MIVSASYRTDIPAFYGEWFRARLRAGYCVVRNPYGGRPYRVRLDPEAVDGFVFWTRNAARFEPVLAEVRDRGHPFVIQYTLTGYPRALERSVPDSAAALDVIHRLAARYGGDAVVWRYDPIVLSSLTPDAFHDERFAALAAALHGATNEVVVSFVQGYRKTRRNLDRAAAAEGFAWRDPEEAEKRALIARLSATAAGHGISLTLCTQPAMVGEAARPARCIDTARLSRVAGRTIAAPEAGNRPGCACHRSRDIGAYDTCPHGCVYCYAIANRDGAQRRHAAHDPTAETLDLA